MLIPNWREVAKRAWSVRLLLVVILLSGIEIALPLIGHRLPIGDLSRALLYFAITCAALVARFTLQRRMGGTL